MNEQNETEDRHHQEVAGIHLSATSWTKFKGDLAFRHIKSGMLSKLQFQPLSPLSHEEGKQREKHWCLVLPPTTCHDSPGGRCCQGLYTMPGHQAVQMNRTLGWPSSLTPQTAKAPLHPAADSGSTSYRSLTSLCHLPSFSP